MKREHRPLTRSELARITSRRPVVRRVGREELSRLSGRILPKAPNNCSMRAEQEQYD